MWQTITEDLPVGFQKSAWVRDLQDQRPGMITAVSLRLLYLISRLLGWLAGQ